MTTMFQITSWHWLHFQSITGCDAERAQFYLESAGYDLALAMASFYEGEGEVGIQEVKMSWEKFKVNIIYMRIWRWKVMRKQIIGSHRAKAKWQLLGFRSPHHRLRAFICRPNTLCDFDPEPNCCWKCWNLGTCESATTSGEDQYWHYGRLGQWQWRRWTGGSTFNWHSDWFTNYGQAFYAGGSSTSGNVILGPKKKKFNVGDVFKVEKKFKYEAQSSLVSGCKRCRCRGGSSWGAWWCWRVRWHQVECSLCFELLLIIAISGRFREVASNLEATLWQVHRWAPNAPNHLENHV